MISKFVKVFSLPICIPINYLSNMGYKNKQTVHGFRHTASTILNEKKTKYGIALSESDLR
jgi:hypothetical protein